MKRYKWFLLILPLFLMVGLNQGCGEVDKENETPTSPSTTTDTSTTTTTTTPASGIPTCTITASPKLVAYGDKGSFTIAITGGPANGTFVPESGDCKAFTNSTGTSCTTASLSDMGKTKYTFTLSVYNTNGATSCTGEVWVGCQGYLVMNDTGETRDFLFDGGYCFTQSSWWITLGARALNKGEEMRSYSAYTNCTGSLLGTLTYANAMNADSSLYGGNDSCSVNFSGSDR